MFKQLDKITTLGLTNSDVNGQQMMDYIWKQYFYETMTSNIKDVIDKQVYDDNYIKKDKTLSNLIGIYPINKVDKHPYWLSDFVEYVSYDLYQMANMNSSTYQLKSEYVNGDKHKEMRAEVQGILYALNNNDNLNLIDGTIVYNKRTLKILKFIVNVFLKFSTCTRSTLEEQAWYRNYMKYKSTKNQLYLVITNSIASYLGMSSYSPRNGDDRVWSSCQHLENADGLFKGMLSTMQDKGNLIAYITSGVSIDYDHDDCNLENYTHQEMQIRCIVRLLIDECDRPTICIDRNYPHDSYYNEIATVVEQLCKDNDLRFSMFSAYNSGQSRQNKDINKWIVDDNRLAAYSSHYIQASENEEYDNDDDPQYNTHYDDQHNCSFYDAWKQSNDDEYKLSYRIYKEVKKPNIEQQKSKYAIDDYVVIVDRNENVLPIGQIKQIDDNNCVIGVEFKNISSIKYNGNTRQLHAINNVLLDRNGYGFNVENCLNVAIIQPEDALILQQSMETLEASEVLKKYDITYRPHHDFIISDIVKITNSISGQRGKYGIVRHVSSSKQSIGVEHYQPSGSLHNLDGLCKNDRGWYYREDEIAYINIEQVPDEVKQAFGIAIPTLNAMPLAVKHLALDYANTYISSLAPTTIQSIIDLAHSITNESGE